MILVNGFLSPLKVISATTPTAQREDSSSHIPKDNLGLRPVCILSMIDRIVYQALFNQGILGFKIDGQLSEKVCFANRINEDEKDERFISPYFKPWENFCEQQEKAFNRGFTWKLDVDMQQYYEHVSINKLVDTLRGDFGIKDDKLLTLLERMLCEWTEDADMPKGIPQGPNASAILANAYLAPLDKLAENELIGRKLRYFRYADDIVLMGKDKTDVLIAVGKIVNFLRERNLTLNEKTKIEELSDSAPIEAMKFFSQYDNDTLEIPADNLAGVQRKDAGHHQGHTEWGIRGKKSASTSSSIFWRTAPTTASISS